MSNQRHKIWNSPSFRNAGKLLSANVVAQVLGLVVYPLLTRMYTPEDFGLLNLFLSIGGVVSLLSTGEYQSAVLLPSREEEASGVVRAALRIAGLWVLATAVTVPFSGGIARLFDAPALASCYWMLVPYVAVTACWTVYNAWLTRRRAFGRISGYQLNQSATGVLTKLLFGWLGWLRSGLVVSSVLAPFIALITSVCHSKEHFRALRLASEEKPAALARKYSRFPLYSLPRALVNNLSGNLPAILLTPYFGLSQLGFFAMAMTLAFRPVTMVTASLHQVLFERVAESVREGKSIWGVLRRRWLQMAAIVVPAMGLLTLGMAWLVRVLLGAGWEETATLIRYMMPWLTCVLLVAPLAFVSEVFGRQKLFLIIEMVYLVLRVGAMAAGIWLGSFETAVILMSAAGTTVLLVQLAVYIATVRRYERSLV